MRRLLLTLLTIILPLSAAAEGEHVHGSPYAGQELREIKSLSAEDVTELERGGGWGLAKAAELNGMPGPTHVLKMKGELPLSAEQEVATQRIFQKMRDEAIVEGKRLIAAETALEIGFRDGSIDEETLGARLGQIEASRARLRFVHLAAHLQMMQVLNADQVKRYNDLRGYGR